MFRDVPGRNRDTGRGSGHPPTSYGHSGPKGETDQPTRGLVRPSTCLDSPREGKGGGLAPPAFPSHGRKEREGRHPPLPFPALQIRKEGSAAWEGPQVGFLLLGHLLWLLLPPSHLYICGRGRQAHNRQLPSRVRCPLHRLHHRSIFVVLRRSPTEIT